MSVKYIHTEEIHNKRAPSIIVPEVIKLINPRSVVDVGCGTGTFLSVFQQFGIEKILGIEGDWLDKTKLQVDEKFVLIKDLEQPFVHHEKFDLAICLEVAEHLSEKASDTIVNTLTGLSNVIIFSAAIPGQIGQGHLNEQWVGYWKRKFEMKNYVYYDILRELFWNNEEVDVWYKQNIFLIIKEGYNKYSIKSAQAIKDRIHPEFYSNYRYMTSKFLKGRIPVSIFIQMLANRLLKSCKTFSRQALNR